MKVATRNNLLKKLANSMWGTNARTTRTTALALCYSTAEYAVPVWARSSHANKLNPVLNKACRSITGCLKPTNIEDLYLIAGIAPPDIRKKSMYCTMYELESKTAREVTHRYRPSNRRLSQGSQQPLAHMEKPQSTENWIHLQ